MELTTNRNYLGLLTGVTTGLKALKFVFFARWNVWRITPGESNWLCQAMDHPITLWLFSIAMENHNF